MGCLQGNMAEDGHRKLGGLKTMPFILGNEFCERFASTGLNANMITYLTQTLHLPLSQASITLTNFAGTAGLTPIIGALIADSFAGRFWTITSGSFIYQLGMISITISAILPSLRPPLCAPHQTCQEASSLQLWVLYISLFLTSIGSGGIRPCVVAFGADQLEPTATTTPYSKTATTSNLFNWFYFSMAIATLMALTLVVYVQDNVGWGWGLGIPTLAMALSVVAFLLGYPLYRCIKPGGSPLTRLTQVVVAAIKKRKEDMHTYHSFLYENNKLDADISAGGRLLHTDQFKFFDRAAIITPDDVPESGAPNLWTISTVHRVEELKSIIRMTPIWSVGIIVIASSAHLSTFAIQQGRTMDRHIAPSLQIPPASMSIFTTLTLLIGVALYDRIFVPIARHYTQNPTGITYFQRMGIGLVMHIIATFISAVVEIMRKNAAIEHGLVDQPEAVIPMSAFWLVPQYSLHGLAEAFVSVGHLEFLYDQTPESMRSTAAALFWLSISAGSYLNTLMVSLVHKYSGNERNWIPDHNINKGRLEYYYWLVTGLQILNLLCYILCAWFYTSKKLDVVGPDSPRKPENLAQGEDHWELSKERSKDVVGHHVDGGDGEKDNAYKKEELV